MALHSVKLAGFVSLVLHNQHLSELTEITRHFVESRWGGGCRGAFISIITCPFVQFSFVGASASATWGAASNQPGD